VKQGWAKRSPALSGKGRGTTAWSLSPPLLLDRRCASRTRSAARRSHRCVETPTTAPPTP